MTFFYQFSNDEAEVLLNGIFCQLVADYCLKTYEEYRWIFMIAP